MCVARSILGTISLAATLLFAVPIALAGVQYLLWGDHVIGGVMLAVAALMVGLQEYLTTPWDIPSKAAQTVVGGIVGSGDDAEEE